jgi:hypothetical protein
MTRRKWLLAALALLLSLRLFPIPTGPIGQSVLKSMAPAVSDFPLTANSVRYRFPFTVSLYEARLVGVPTMSSPRIDIGFSPWALMAGKLKIASISSPSVNVQSQLAIEPALSILDRLQSVPLRAWFPAQYLPGHLIVNEMMVRDPDGVLLVKIKDLELRRKGDELDLSIDNATVLGALPIRSLEAHGKLPFSLDTLTGELPGGRFAGKMSRVDSSLHMTVGLSMDLSHWPLGLGNTQARGLLQAKAIDLVLPLDGRPMKLSGHIQTDSLELTDFPYIQDGWIRQFTPELRHVRFVTGGIELRGLTPKHLLVQLDLKGDTVTIKGNGRLGLDGSLAFRMKTGMCHGYAATRPGLLRAALQPGKDGYSYTSVQMSGCMREIHFSPTSEAVADAASSPFHTLSELFH